MAYNSQTGMFDFSNNAPVTQDTGILGFDPNAFMQQTVAAASAPIGTNSLLANQAPVTDMVGNANSNLQMFDADGGVLPATPPKTGSSFFGENGWGNTAIAGANALAQSWLGFENLGVAKDQYNLQKDTFNFNKTNYTDAMARKQSALNNS